MLRNEGEWKPAERGRKKVITTRYLLNYIFRHSSAAKTNLKHAALPDPSIAELEHHLQYLQTTDEESRDAQSSSAGRSSTQSSTHHVLHRDEVSEALRDRCGTGGEERLGVSVRQTEASLSAHSRICSSELKERRRFELKSGRCPQEAFASSRPVSRERNAAEKPEKEKSRKGRCREKRPGAPALRLRSRTVSEGCDR
ncbi:hypothetical protein AOLI_G00282850 [Acnodon oligacanthus]